MKQRKAIALAVTLLVMAALGVWFGLTRLLDRSPAPPDFAKMDLKSAMAYESTDEYARLNERHRQQFSEGVMQRLRALPFEDLLRTALDPSNLDMHRRRLANLRKLPNFDELHSMMAADFLQKFYKLPEFKRSIYLTAFAVYTEMDARADPDRYKTPKPGDFHADAVKLFSGQSPVMKAYGMQFMIDLKQQRRRLGLKDRALPMK